MFACAVGYLDLLMMIVYRLSVLLEDCPEGLNAGATILAAGCSENSWQELSYRPWVGTACSFTYSHGHFPVSKHEHVYISNLFQGVLHIGFPSRLLRA